MGGYVRDKVGKGVRVIGFSKSFNNGEMINARYEGFHVSVSGGTATTFFTYTNCPSWAGATQSDSDGDCKCPSGSTCKTNKHDSCPRSQGKWSDTYFLPMCAESWSSVRCTCEYR